MITVSSNLIRKNSTVRTQSFYYTFYKMEFGQLFVGLVLVTRSIYGIVLHSDVDLAREILLLKQEVAQLKARQVPQSISE